jgi:hypothetical protein
MGCLPRRVWTVGRVCQRDRGSSQWPPDTPDTPDTADSRLSLYQNQNTSSSHQAHHRDWEPARQTGHNWQFTGPIGGINIDQYRSILIIIPPKHSSSYLSMPKTRNTVKAADVLRRKSKAKAIEWEPRMYSRGIRDVPVEVISTAHQSRLKKKGTRQPSAENDNMLQGEAAPHPMDVDETFWAEEPVVPTSEKRVRQPAPPFLANLTHISQTQHDYIGEFIPKISPYLDCLLNLEGVPATTTCQSCQSAPFEWRCSDCFPALVLCKECCRKSHQRLPFHRVQKWALNYFKPSWLREVGVHLQLGHSGDPCPNQIVCYDIFSVLDPIQKRIYSLTSTMNTKTNTRVVVMTFLQMNIRWQLIRRNSNLASTTQSRLKMTMMETK